jgi:hypothetical protein
MTKKHRSCPQCARLLVDRHKMMWSVKHLSICLVQVAEELRQILGSGEDQRRQKARLKKLLHAIEAAILRPPADES